MLPSNTCFRERDGYFLLTVAEDEGEIAVCGKKYEDAACTIRTTQTEGCDLSWSLLESCTDSFHSWKRMEHFCSRTDIPPGPFVNALVEQRFYDSGMDGGMAECQQDVLDDEANGITSLSDVTILFGISDASFCHDVSMLLTQTELSVNSQIFYCKGDDLVYDAFTDGQCNTNQSPSSQTADESVLITKECSQQFDGLFFTRAVNCASPTIFCKDLSSSGLPGIGLGDSETVTIPVDDAMGSTGGGGAPTDSEVPPEANSDDPPETNGDEPPEVDSSSPNTVKGALSFCLRGLIAARLVYELFDF